MWEARNVMCGMKVPARLASAVRRFAADNSGTSAMEYALLTLIALAILVAVGQVADAVRPMYEKVFGIFGG